MFRIVHCNEQTCPLSSDSPCVMTSTDEHCEHPQYLCILQAAHHISYLIGQGEVSMALEFDH